MLLTKYLSLSKNINIIANANNILHRSKPLGLLQIKIHCKELEKNVSTRSIHTSVVQSRMPSQNKIILESHNPLVIALRYTGFFNRSTAESLWKGVTSVSNAGRKRGRAKAGRKMYARNLNRGQFIGIGEENMVWPGLNAPVTRGKEMVKQELLPKDKDRMKKLIDIRNSMGKFKALRLNPLERGWAGTRLPGRSIGPPDPIGDDHFVGFDTKVLESKMVKTMTRTHGQKRQSSVFSVTGNKNGVAGFALAKSSMMDVAANRSRNLSGQRLMYIERCDGHTVFHDFYCEFMSTRIFVKRKPEGYGLVCHRGIKEICTVLGIKNLYAKVEGSTNIQNITKAFFLGLLNQKNHQKLADEKQLYVAKLRPHMHPEVVATPSSGKIRSKEEIPMDEEMDFTIHCMEGRVPVERKKFVPFYVYLPSWEQHLKKYSKKRNHEKIEKQQLIEYGNVISFLTAKYPECKKVPRRTGREKSTKKNE